jgi:hypothetical protein
VRPGDTRWGSHHKTLCRIIHMWDAVLEVLEIVSDDASSGGKKYTAARLLKQMESFEFVLVLHLMIRLLGKTNDLSQCLQMKDQNIVHAIGLIGTTLHKMNDIRENGWDELFEEVENFCLLHHIIVPKMDDTLTVRWTVDNIFSSLQKMKSLMLSMTKLLRCIACLDPQNSFANFDVVRPNK